MSKKTIYLEDAIEAICKACSMEEDYHKCDGYPDTSMWCDGLVALRALPSAQPESERLKSCKNCIHLGHGYMMPCKNCRRNQIMPDWYEERREDDK